MPSSSRQIRKALSLRGLFSLLVENRDELHAERTGELNPSAPPYIKMLLKGAGACPAEGLCADRGGKVASAASARGLGLGRPTG